MTSSLWERVREEARWPTPWPPRASGSCCWSGATSCRGRRRTGSPGPSSLRAATSRPDSWKDADGNTFQPGVHYYVGGATKLYGAALYRLRPGDFGELTHVDGVSPAWPLTYDDFEPWYTKAEWLYQVHGCHGEDPTEGSWSRQYPFPAVSHEPRIEQMAADLAKAGYHPFNAPCGILLDEEDPAGSKCIRCTWCDGYPCLVQAKADAETIAVRPALQHPNVTLQVNTEVTRLETDSAGRSVTGVVTQHNGNEETLTADIVVLSAGATNSAKILLAFGQRRPPGRAGQRLGPGRAELHVPQLQGRCGAGQGAQRHLVPKDAGLERLLFRQPRLRLPSRQPTDGGQVQRRGDEGRRTPSHASGAALEPRRRRRPCGGLLADDRGPSEAREPGHSRQATGPCGWPTRRPTTRRPAGSTAS